MLSSNARTLRHVMLLAAVSAMGCSSEPSPQVGAGDSGLVIITGSDAQTPGADVGVTDSPDARRPDARVDAADLGRDAGPMIDPVWAPVDEELRASFADNPMGAVGMTLIVVDANDRRVFESTIGDFAPDRRVAVASASKLVSGLVLMRLIEDPALNLSLNTTVGEVMDDWLSENGMINLDQLGAFTSGLPVDDPCLLRSDTTLAECVAGMANATLTDAPGSDFSYGPTHLQVAARVAEVSTRKQWQTLFEEQLTTPLGITDPELRYVTFPRANQGTTNPRVAGGLRATANEYLQFLRLLFHHGTVDGQTLIPASAMQRFQRNDYRNADILNSPFAGTPVDYRYGWASWLECDGPVAMCDVVSSPGAFGFTPWVDFGNGYYAVLAMEAPESGAGFEAALIAARLKPLIAAALR